MSIFDGRDARPARDGNAAKAYHQMIVGADCDASDSQCETAQPLRGELLARQVAENQRIHVGRQGMKGSGSPEPTAPDTMPAAVLDLDQVIDHQRQVLCALYDALSEHGLLKPSPPNTTDKAGAGNTPTPHRLSDRLRDLAYRVRSHNDGLVEILHRLDV